MNNNEIKTSGNDNQPPATVENGETNGSKSVETVPTVSHGLGRGGKNNTGRPKGTHNKLTAKILLDKVSERGVPFEEGLAEDYLNSAGDKELRFKYNQLFLNKVMADLKHIEIDETSTVEHRQHAFLKALETIGTVALQQEQANTVEATVVEPQAIEWDTVDHGLPPTDTLSVGHRKGEKRKHGHHRKGS